MLASVRNKLTSFGNNPSGSNDSRRIGTSVVSTEKIAVSAKLA
jgi:hypothetical protein